jgi:hypothetical protein
MSTQQAYINGFVKRASGYGLDQNQAVELLKQAEPAYERPSKLTEEDLKNMSYSDLQDYTSPKEGKGIMAHLKRNKMKYLGALLGGASMGDDGLVPLLAGASVGAGVGYIPDKALNALSKGLVKREANKNISDLKKHIINQSKLNAPVNRNLHSLSFM